MREPSTGNWRAQALGLALGLAGGALFAWIRAPLAWMLGAMVATTLASFSGLRLATHASLRQAMVAVLGVMLGSAFTPAVLRALERWWISLALLGLVIVLMTAVAYVFFRRVGKFDPVTAYFSATPGGLVSMSILGDAEGGDMRRISLVHAVRILFVVSVIPFYFRVIQGLDVPTMPPQAGHIWNLAWADAVVLAACAIMGALAAARFKAPAPALTGPMVLSALVHGLGWSRVSPPMELIAPAQMVLGVAIGTRFSGFDVHTARQTLLLAASASAAMIAAGAGLAALAAPLLGLSYEGLFLAMAPGGLVEMAMIALSLGIDTAFVSSMHVLRVVSIVSLAPLVFRLARRRNYISRSNGSRTAP